MARLNEEFQLTFHEVDSSIHIGFGEDEALLYIDDMKEIAPIPIEFEESTSRIPVNIADKEQLPALFGDVVIVHGGTPGDDYYTKAQTDALLNAKQDTIDTQNPLPYSYLSGAPNLANVATSGSYADLTNTPTFTDVATSGSYNDLTDTPTIPDVSNFVEASDLAAVATSGSYTDLTNKPTLITDVQKNSTSVVSNGVANVTVPTQTSDLTNNSGFITNATDSLTNYTKTSDLATVATSGAYNDLTGKPTLATVATSGDYTDLTNIPTLANVATTGDYEDLLNTPTIPDVSTKVDKVTSTDNAIVCFDGTTGAIQNNTHVIIDDNGNLKTNKALILSGVTSSISTGDSRLYFGDDTTNYYSYLASDTSGAFSLTKGSYSFTFYPNTGGYNCLMTNSGASLGRGNNDGSYAWGDIITKGKVQVFKTGSSGFYDILWPQKAGTVALTSDIPTVSYPVTSVNSQTGDVVITLPTDLGDLTNNAGYLKLTDLATVASTGSYNDLTDLPTLPQYLSDLQEDSDSIHVSQSQASTWSGKQDALTFDSAPTEDSNNPVTSDGIYDAIQDVREIAEGKSAAYIIDDTVQTEFNSQTNPIHLIGTTFTDANNVSHNVADLKLGDVCYVTQTDVPDRWVSNVELNQTVSGLANTTWKFNDVLSSIYGNWTVVNLSFTANGASYTSLRGYTSTGKIHLQYGTTEVYNAGTTGWLNEANQTITISGGTDVETANVISWMGTNAVLQGEAYNATLNILETANDLATVATSGSYNDLSNKPTIPSAPGTLNTTATTAQSTSASEALSGTVTLHKVAKTGTYSDLIDTPTISTTPTTGTGLWDANTIINYIASRGQQLVTNGTFLLANNYNFSTGTYDGSDANTSGGCVYKTGAAIAMKNDEFIAIDKTKLYRLTYDLKPNVGFDAGVNATSGVSGFLPYIDQFDLDKNNIIDSNTNYKAGTLVQLTRDLVTGDTSMEVTDGSAWTTFASVNATLQIWDYSNSKGYRYSPGEYTRHTFNMGTSSSTSGNVISFQNAYSGTAVPAGTWVSQNHGGDYAYIGSYDMPAANVWSHWSHDTTASTIRGGCAFAKIGWLWNYNIGNKFTDYDASAAVPIGRIIKYNNQYYFCYKAVEDGSSILPTNTDYYTGPYASVGAGVKTKITNIQLTIKSLI